MKNWKVKLAGFVTACINLMIFAGVLSATPEEKAMLVSSVTAIGVFLMSLFAKDSDVTGGNKAQTPEAEKRVGAWRCQYCGKVIPAGRGHVCPARKNTKK